MIIKKQGRPTTGYLWLFTQPITCPKCAAEWMLERRDHRVYYAEHLHGGNQFLVLNDGAAVLTVCPTPDCGVRVEVARPETT